MSNCVQATARDILMYAMQTLRCCSIVAHVHDELIIECDRRVSLAAVCEQMGRTPPWAKGLLLRADGYNSDIDALMAELEGRGFHTEDTIAKADTNEPDEAPAAEPEAAPTEEATDPSGYGLTVSIPANTLGPDALANLTSLLAAKGRLIRAALGLEALPVEVGPDTVSFPWFEGRHLDADEAKTYTHLIAALCEMARNQKRITAKEKITDNDKYAFRCFLLRLGFIGAEFKDERKILLRNLSGNSAFKSGKPHAEVLQPEPPTSTAAVEVQGDPALAEALADELLIQQVNASFGEEAAS